MSSAHERPARKGPLGLFDKIYGAGPLHLVGHLIVIAIAAKALSLMFQMPFAPRPWNLALWLLGGAVLHDAVFLPIYAAINTVFSNIVGAGNDDSLLDATLGPPPVGVHVIPPAITKDQQRRVPVINHVRFPFIIAAAFFIVFLPRITNRQPQNFSNALGHSPPDYFARWLLVIAVVFIGSALLYGVRWVLARRQAQPALDAAETPDSAGASA